MVINQGEHERGEKADRAAQKEERSSNRDGVEKGEKKSEGKMVSAGVQQDNCRQRLGHKKLTGEEGLGVQQGNINI